MEGGIQKHLLLKLTLLSLFSSFALFSLSLPPPLFAPAVRRRYSYRWLSPWAAKCSNRYFSELEEHSGIFAEKKSCVLCRNFISIYKINRTFHGRLGIRILSSRADRYFQHSKIKFASPRPCNILYIRATKATKKWITKTGSQYQKRSHASFKQPNNNMALATTLNNTS